MLWSVGITTCDGRDYLDGTIASINEAGWPAVLVSEDANRQLGPWGNILKVVRSLVPAKPDAILVCQDDVIMTKRLRPWLESQLAAADWWPGAGVVSLYLCQGEEAKRPAAWHEVPERIVVRSGSGACAFVLPLESAKMLIADPPCPTAFCLADVLLRSHCQRTHRPWIDHRPSLSRHVGRRSALREVPGEKERRPEPAWTPYRHEGGFLEEAEQPEKPPDPAAGFSQGAIQ